MERPRISGQPTGSDEEATFNPTPFPMPPYSGANIHVMAFFPYLEDTKRREIRIEIEDLFGKTLRRHHHRVFLVAQN